jgi:SAM-dependent methyltransferase
MLFPAEFDLEAYWNRYADLRHLNLDELRQHWQNHGISEGRSGNSLSNRSDFTNLISNSGSVLEIGPFNAPLKKGPNVKYFDVLDRNALIARAKQIGYDPATIPEIDFVEPNGNLEAISGTFDYIVSSHVVEHQPNLIKHLTDAYNLLAAGGYYFVIVPDKRYCFDHFIPESNLAQVIDAHINRLTRHPLARVIEHRALTTHNDPLRHWQGDHGERHASLKARYQSAASEYQQSQGGYIDVHGWYFTPVSFRHIIDGLRQIGLTSFTPIRVYPTLYAEFEFRTILQKNWDFPVKRD